jgi:hypothetical protein
MAILNGRKDPFSLTRFHPPHSDCNGSLRISAGHVAGCRFADAIDHLPRTTLQGLFDKAADARAGGSAIAAEFECPERMYSLLAADESTRQIPVSFLVNCLGVFFSGKSYMKLYIIICQ